jgi:hypothetical protein
MLGRHVSFATNAARALLLPGIFRRISRRIPWCAARHANVGIALACFICLNKPDRSDRLSG